MYKSKVPGFYGPRCSKFSYKQFQLQIGCAGRDIVWHITIITQQRIKFIHTILGQGSNTWQH